MIIKYSNLVSVVLLLFFLCSFVFASETNERKLEIKAYSSEIKVGEPLILEIHTISNTPNINPKTGEIVISGKMDTQYLIVTQKGQKEEMKYEISQVTLVDNSGKGLEYSGSLIAFYDQNIKSLLFKEPGVYSCRLEDRAKTVSSNVLEINVKSASKLEKKALSILTGEYDLVILNSEKYVPTKDLPDPKTIDRFKQVVEQCGDTMLAKIAAARLGIEETKEFENKYSENGSFIEQYRKGEIKDPLIDSAKKYLSIAYELPDGVPIRETAIYNLATFELFDGKTSKAFSIYDELAAKYPQGKYVKQAISDKKDSQEFIDSHPDLFVAEQEPSQETKPLGVVLPIAGVAVAAVVIAGLFIFLRKKNPKTKKSE
jgi:hypothetical protein